MVRVVEELRILVVELVVEEEVMVSSTFIRLFPDWNVCFGKVKVLTYLLPTSTQSGGAGGRGGAQSYYSFRGYCDDNAQNDGQYCVGKSAGYDACCNGGGSPGDPYDNDDNVSSLMYLPGSGGGAGAGTATVSGGAGGASIVLYSNEMTLNGMIKANGGDGGTSSDYYSAGGGGGSGGAIVITACTVTTGSNGLSAIIQAKGGNGGTSSGGGKMIFSIHLFTFSSSFSLSLFR